MLSGLFARKSRVNSAIQQAEADVAAKRRTVAETKKQLEALQRQRGSIVSSQYDQQALLRLTNDDAEKAQQIENKIAELTAQLPILDKEIADLESEIVPRLDQELKAAEHAEQVTFLAARQAIGQEHGERRVEVGEQWNAALKMMLAAIDAVGQYSGGAVWHQTNVTDAARNLRVDAGPLPKHLPEDIIEEFRRVLRPRYQAALAEGARIASEAWQQVEGSVSDMDLTVSN